MAATRKADAAFNVGQECRCRLEVSNSGSAAADNVVVETAFPTSARLVSAQPDPTATGSVLSWTLGTLSAGETKTIEVVLVPSATGDFNPTAEVRHTSTVVAGFNVLQPLLDISVSGPGEVYSGDPASQVVTISNPGTGVAKKRRPRSNRSRRLGTRPRRQAADRTW